MAAPTLLAASLRTIGSLASGLLVAGGFPPYDQTWMLPVGLAGLMLTVRDCRGRGGFAQGLVFGLAFMLPLMRWITIIGADAWIALGLLEALPYALMAMAWAWLRPLRWWPVAFALVWVAGEALRSTVPFGGLPWGNLAFGLVGTSLVRYGRLGGTSLVAFAVVLAVGLVVLAVERRERSAVGAATLALGVAIPLVSLVLPVGAASPEGSVVVAAVQGNVPGEGMDPFAERRAVLHNHAQTTHSFADAVARGDAPQPEIVIWPENSTDIDPFVDSSAYAEIAGAVRAIGVPTLVGAVVNGPDRLHVQNMGVVWDPASGPGEQYIKRHPVPFGEYIPFRKILTKYIGRLSQIPRDFARGSTIGVLDLGPVRIGDVICFEVAYDGLIRDAMMGGGRLLVVQTNNATYTGTGQLEQQFAISRYRAIETGRTVVVAATDGISGVITPKGQVVAKTEQRTRAVLDEQVTLAEGITWGVRYGIWLKVVLSVLAVAVVVWSRLGARRRLGRMET